jgi:hypothetical protein
MRVGLIPIQKQGHCVHCVTEKNKQKGSPTHFVFDYASRHVARPPVHIDHFSHLLRGIFCVLAHCQMPAMNAKY